MTASVIIGFLVLSTLSSCNTDYQEISTEKVAYPTSWPISDLTVPSTSVKHCINSDLMSNDNQPYTYSDPSSEIWIVGYYNELGWDGNIKHYDSLLLDSSMGYIAIDPSQFSEIEIGDDIQKVKHYVNSSHDTRVTVIYGKQPFGGYSTQHHKYEFELPYEGYVLQIAHGEFLN